MSLFEIREFVPGKRLAPREPDGCELCGHCRMLRQLWIQAAAKRGASLRPEWGSSSPEPCMTTEK